MEKITYPQGSLNYRLKKYVDRKFPDAVNAYKISPTLLSCSRCNHSAQADMLNNENQTKYAIYCTNCNQRYETEMYVMSDRDVKFAKILYLWQSNNRKET